MYIHYRIVHQGRSVIWDDKKDFNSPYFIMLPSECTWIIPGTVNIDD